jgi:hypothetical protein
LVERIVVDQPLGGDRRDAERIAVLGHQLVEDLLDALGEGAGLLLLQRDAHHAGAGAGLQVEGAGAGLADGADDQPVGPVELVDGG